MKTGRLRANTGNNWRWDHTLEDRAIEGRTLEDRGKINCWDCDHLKFVY